MPGSIVCALDRSAGSLRGLRLAAELCDALDTRLVLVHVARARAPVTTPVGAPVGAPMLPEDPGPAVRSGRTFLQDIAVRERLEEVVVQSEYGSPAERILGVAAEAGARLIVLGSRGEGPLRAAVLGSVSATVMREAFCPVVIVPKQAAVRPLAAPEGLIVCGVDGSDEAQEALSTAAGLAVKLDCRLAMVHVCPPPEIPGMATVSGAAERLAELEKRDGETLLAELAAAEQLGTEVERRVVFGSPAEALARTALSEEAGLLAVGSRGRGGMRSALFGTVSGTLAANAPCPVLVVPRAAWEHRHERARPA